MRSASDLSRPLARRRTVTEQRDPARPPEREWVTLRLTAQFDGPDTLVARIRDTAQFADAADLLSHLEKRGLIVDDALSTAGAELVAEIGREIGAIAEPIWSSVDPADAAAAARALNSVLAQTRALLRA